MSDTHLSPKNLHRVDVDLLGVRHGASSLCRSASALGFGVLDFVGRKNLGKSEGGQGAGCRSGCEQRLMLQRALQAAASRVPVRPAASRRFFKIDRGWDTENPKFVDQYNPFGKPYKMHESMQFRWRYAWPGFGWGLGAFVVAYSYEQLTKPAHHGHGHGHGDEDNAHGGHELEKPAAQTQEAGAPADFSEMRSGSFRTR